MANHVDVDAIARESRGEFDESGGIYFYRKAWGFFAHDLARTIRNAALEEAAALLDSAAANNEAAKDDKVNVTTMEALIFAGAGAQARKSAENIRKLKEAP